MATTTRRYRVNNPAISYVPRYGSDEVHAVEGDVVDDLTIESAEALGDAVVEVDGDDEPVEEPDDSDDDSDGQADE